jgi:outer membrane protein assembly factor BamE
VLNSERILMKLSIVALALLLGACSLLPDRFGAYRIDVRQGNFVTQDMVTQLKPGQTREQVRFILGSPLIQDAFHADRWDYVYRLAKGNGTVTERKLTVFFSGNTLQKVAGDVTAAGEGDTPETANKSRVIEIAPRQAKS